MVFYCKSWLQKIHHQHLSRYTKVEAKSSFSYNLFTMSKKQQALRDLVNNELKDETMNLYWLSWKKKGQRWALTIYIDSEDTVTTQNCQRISKKLAPKLEESDLIDRSYDLEVSSPGVERPLKNLDHFETALGSRIKVKTYRPIKGQRSHVGVLQNIQQNDKGHQLTLSTEEAKTSIRFDDIAQASTYPNLDI